LNLYFPNITRGRDWQDRGASTYVGNRGQARQRGKERSTNNGVLHRWEKSRLALGGASSIKICSKDYRTLSKKKVSRQRRK